MSQLNTLFVTWFYLGKLPKAPGTFGTIGAIPLIFLLGQIEWEFAYMVVTLFLAIAGILACEWYEQSHNSHDSSELVVDEVVGYLITMTWIPLNWKTIGLGFILFRFLDIVKPFPINIIDRRAKGGLGVMADDILAGVIANIALQLLLARCALCL